MDAIMILKIIAAMVALVAFYYLLRLAIQIIRAIFFIPAHTIRVMALQVNSRGRAFDESIPVRLMVSGKAYPGEPYDNAQIRVIYNEYIRDYASMYLWKTADEIASEHGDYFAANIGQNIHNRALEHVRNTLERQRKENEKHAADEAKQARARGSRRKKITAFAFMVLILKYANKPAPATRRRR